MESDHINDGHNDDHRKRRLRDVEKQWRHELQGQ